MDFRSVSIWCPNIPFRSLVESINRSVSRSFSQSIVQWCVQSPHQLFTMPNALPLRFSFVPSLAFPSFFSFSPFIASFFAVCHRIINYPVMLHFFICCLLLFRFIFLYTFSTFFATYSSNNFFAVVAAWVVVVGRRFQMQFTLRFRYVLHLRDNLWVHGISR